MKNWQRAALVLATVGAAAAPAAAQADAVQASCQFDGKGPNSNCGVAFRYAGGTVTISSAVSGGSNRVSWHLANSDTYEVPCRGGFPQGDQVQSWTCTVPAGRYYLYVSTTSYGSHGFINASW